MGKCWERSAQRVIWYDYVILATWEPEGIAGIPTRGFPVWRWLLPSPAARTPGAHVGAGP